MTYRQLEQGRVSGHPVELVQFVSGTQAWRMTSAVEPQAHFGHEYVPTPVRIGSVRQTDEADAGSVIIRLPRDHALADLLLTGMLYDPVAVTVFRRHRDPSPAAPTFADQLGDPALEPESIAPFTGQVSQASVVDGELVISCVSVQALLETVIPQRVISRMCPHMQYGVACGLTLAAWQESHEVTATASGGLILSVPTLFSGNFIEDATLFAAGIVSLNGRHRMITHQTGTDLRLLGPLPDLGIGSFVLVAPSCGRLVERCDGQFDNLHHFGGFPGMPERNPFVGRMA